MRAIFNFTLNALIFALIGAVIASSFYPTLDTSYAQLQKNYDDYVNAQARFMTEPSKNNIQKVDQHENFIFPASYVLEQQSWLNSFVLRKKPVLTSKQQQTLRYQLANAEKLNEQFQQTALQQVYHAENLAPYLRANNAQTDKHVFVTHDSNGTSISFDANNTTFKNVFTNSITANYFLIKTKDTTFYLRKELGYKIESKTTDAITIKMGNNRLHLNAIIESDE